MSFFSNLLIILFTLFGIGVVGFIIIQFFILWLEYKLIKKYPIPALIIAGILIVAGILGTLDPFTLVPALIVLVSQATLLIVRYKSLKKALKN